MKTTFTTSMTFVWRRLHSRKQCVTHDMMLQIAVFREQQSTVFAILPGWFYAAAERLKVGQYIWYTHGLQTTAFANCFNVVICTIKAKGHHDVILRVVQQIDLHVGICPLLHPTAVQDVLEAQHKNIVDTFWVKLWSNTEILGWICISKVNHFLVPVFPINQSKAFKISTRFIIAI